MEVFGKPVIDRYRKGEMDTATFCDKYLDLYAYDEPDEKSPFAELSDRLFGLCVNYQDPTENKAEVENEIREVIREIKESD